MRERNHKMAADAETMPFLSSELNKISEIPVIFAEGVCFSRELALTHASDDRRSLSSPDGGAVDVTRVQVFEIARFLDAHLFAKKVENVAQATLVHHWLKRSFQPIVTGRTSNLVDPRVKCGFFSLRCFFSHAVVAVEYVSETVHRNSIDAVVVEDKLVDLRI